MENPGEMKFETAMVAVESGENGGEGKKKNLFECLPGEMLAEILSYMDPITRQQLRTISRLWKNVVDYYYGIHLEITNMNWNFVEDCPYVKSISLCGFSRDVMNPTIITSRLVSLELTDLVAYYSFMPILEHCHVLQSFIVDCVTFLNKSRLPKYSAPEYIEPGSEMKRKWLPKLKYFRFVSCTTQRGVYNHIFPNEYPEDFYNLEDPTRSFDISRGEMEFVPFMLQILLQSTTLVVIEMVLTDIWKVPFAELFRVNVDISTEPTLNVSLWHFGSKRLLPIGSLFQKVPSVTRLRFSFPHHYDTFFMELKPRPVNFHEMDSSSSLLEPFQLEEVCVQQSLRWSQEMREVDTPWLQILEKQFHLQRFEYPFPIFGADHRIARIIEQNSGTLKSITFTGHRENRDGMEQRVFRPGNEGPDPLNNDLRTSLIEPWDSEWFSNCDALEHLTLKSHTRFLAPTSVSSLVKPNLLPVTLKQFHFHGCIDFGRMSLCVAFNNLVNLEVFSHQARICPWFILEGVPVSELIVSHVKDVLLSLPKLKRWKLEWCDTTSAMMAHFVINSQLRHSAFVSRHVLEWIEGLMGSVECEEISLDRQMKQMNLKIISRNKIS